MLRTFLSVLITATLFCVPSHAQNSHHHGHSQWHEGFYKNLMRKDTKTSCCNLNDCRPTQSRMIGEYYEVLVDGEWIKADQSVIQNLSAPDGGTHVCAPPQVGTMRGKLYCVVLPPEG